MYRIAADANGVLPSNSALRGRLIAAFEDGGNFVDGIEERQFTVMPALSAELFDGAGHLVRLSGVHQDFDGESFLGIPLLANGEVPDIPPERFVGGDGLRHRNSQNDGANFSYDHEFLNNLKLSIKGRYSRSDAISRDIYAYAPVSPNGDVYITSSLRDIDHEAYTGELFLSRAVEAFDRRRVTSSSAWTTAIRSATSCWDTPTSGRTTCSIPEMTSRRRATRRCVR